MRQRDKDVFTVLVREHTGMLLTYIRTMIRDEATVDDIFQETMLTAWRRFDDYDTTRPLSHWLRGIARKLILAHYSHGRERPTGCRESVLAAIDGRMAQIDSRSGDTWSDKVAALDRCMERLPEPLHRSVRLFYENECSTEEIAEQMQTTREAIKKRLQRARTMLAECLRRCGLFPLPAKEASP